MKSPAELMDVLRRFEDAQSAVGVYREALEAIKGYQEVKAAALDCARSEMESDGVIKATFDHGSAGWTRPRSKRLNRQRWEDLLTRDDELRRLQEDADRAAALLEQAQDEAGVLELPEPRFYIRS